jgi:hypothetical protein
MKVFEKRFLRRIFGPKGEEMPGGWRKKKLVPFARYN